MKYETVLRLGIAQFYIFPNPSSAQCMRCQSTSKDPSYAIISEKKQSSMKRTTTIPTIPGELLKGETTTIIIPLRLRGIWDSFV